MPRRGFRLICVTCLEVVEGVPHSALRVQRDQPVAVTVLARLLAQHRCLQRQVPLQLRVQVRVLRSHLRRRRTQNSKYIFT
eukprot:4315065-Pyramimonas_sp.AAC.1